MPALLIHLVNMSCPSVDLNTGQQMPIVGLGTSKSPGATIRNVVKDALNAGYRHFDCAYVYQNEMDIGDVIQNYILKGKLGRENLFISSKLGCSFGHPSHIHDAYQKTLKNLRLEYLDLFYIHWPFALKYTGPDNLFPSDEHGNLLFDEKTDFIDTWRELEKLYTSEKVKAIGLCNFNISQIQRILDECNITPAVHQFECHPYLGQQALVDFCHSKNISVVGYSPLCSSDRPNLPANVSIFNEGILKTLAAKYKKSVGQIILRYQIQRGITVIPRSTNATRIADNINIFDFELSDEDISSINELDRGIRIMYPDKFSTHKHFPF
uniref:aldo-keto reductase family 1 member B1-like n=1 Tax=Styela clava TaxID=7725 RepID=UPI001939788B|nr:aldo-keto reductase family 1 member B1-like [Styela clava]